MRLAVVISHPIQYYSPIFRELAKQCDLHVFYGMQLSDELQGEGGFGHEFQWDTDLLFGYQSTTMRNVAKKPSTTEFRGCDTPDIFHHLREGNFDVVLILGWYLKSYVQALAASKKLRVPTLIRGDSTLEMPRSRLKRLAKKAIYPIFLRLFDGALYVGQKSRNFYTYYKYPSDRLHFSPHCVDNDWFAGRATETQRDRLRGELGISPTAFVVLLAGKLIPLKRPLDALNALARCRVDGRDVELLVAGSGELQNAIELRAAVAGLPVHLLGFQNQTEMPVAYAAADALILPSSTESWGLVANEALASGTPIVVSNACGCAPDLAADGSVGRVSTVGDIFELSCAIKSIMDRPPTPAALRLRADQYSVDRAVNGILFGANAVDVKRRRKFPK